MWPFLFIKINHKNSIKSIFDPGYKSKGALWSSDVFFGDFVFPDSARMITELSEGVNCEMGNGIGYFYEEWSEKC